MGGEWRVEKRLRMVLDFEVVVEGLTDERLRAHYRRSANYDELVGDAGLWANLTRQVRLQEALLADEGALGRYVTYVVVDEVDPTPGARLGEVFGVDGTDMPEEVVREVFGRLGEEDARYFREVSEEGCLFESMEVLDRSFVVRWVGASLVEVKEVAQGSFEEAEGDPPAY